MFGSIANQVHSDLYSERSKFSKLVPDETIIENFDLINIDFARTIKPFSNKREQKWHSIMKFVYTKSDIGYFKSFETVNATLL